MTLTVALRFAYDGEQFPRGYARQPEGGTVEDALLKALRHEGYVAGSWKTGSRTDRGVSALENVAACQLERAHMDGLCPALQAKLPPGVWMLGAAQVDPEWNPRHHALRTYRYVAPMNGEHLDVMRTAAAMFVGEHNLSAFAKVEPPRDPIRRIPHCDVAEVHGAWEFTISSPGFLWNQVRRMVHAILRVGGGKLPLAAIEDALESGKAHVAMKLAPAEGLLLESVTYTPEIPWDPAAGGVVPRYVASSWQAARVRSALMQELFS